MDWKDKLSALSANLPQVPAEENTNDIQQQPAKEKKKCLLRVELDKRKGKPATLISEFEGSDEELKELAKLLKQSCSAGGSARGGEILIQGDFRKKVAEILEKQGYKVKRINFSS